MDQEVAVEAGMVTFYSPKAVAVEATETTATSTDNRGDYVEGVFTPTDSTAFGSSTIPFQIWFSSGLLYIDADTDLADAVVDRLVTAIDEALGDRDQIHQDFTPYLEQVWGFVDEADEPRRIEVVTPYGSARTLSHATLAEAHDQFPINRAELRFTVGNRAVDVTLADDQLSIDSTNEDLRSHVLDRFDTAFTGAANGY
ncbi:hypothetical protein ACFQE1_03170 [Halobium palmae]|uniref:Uncharacterized protein n=1 Tax=Halobium palmae TaxID=1776492 RepID=A0ABD5RVX7_9EURY